MTPEARRHAPAVPGVFDDRLIRPFLVLAMVAVVAAQLLGSPSPDAAASSWPLFVPVALLAIWSITPLVHQVPTWTQTALFTLYAVLAAALFPIPAQTFSAGFVFMATLAAGQLLRSQKAAVVVAVIGAVACAAANYSYDLGDPSPWPWWLGLTAGFPVWIGLARRQRLQAKENAARMATETERAAASEAREAALLERGRIARDLHDVLGHSLSGIAIQLDLAQVLRVQHRDVEADAAVARARELARSGVAETRTAIHALHEDRPPLVEAIRTIAGDYGAAFRTTGSPRRMAVERSQTIIRAAQESLTNAHRHAPGSAVEVTLEYSDDDWCHLTVRNDPARTRPPDDLPPSNGPGMGTAGMHERARALDGTCRTGPLEDGSWQVVMSLPA